MTLSISISTCGAPALVRQEAHRETKTSDGLARSNSYTHSEEFIPANTSKSFTLSDDVNISIKELPRDATGLDYVSTEVETGVTSGYSDKANAEIADAGLAVEVAGGEMVDTTN